MQLRAKAMHNPIFERDGNRLILKTGLDFVVLFIGAVFVVGPLLGLITTTLKSAQPGSTFITALLAILPFVSIGTLMVLPHQIITTFDLTARRVNIDLTAANGWYRSHRDVAFSDVLYLGADEDTDGPTYSLKLRLRCGGLVGITMWNIQSGSYM